MRSYTEYRGVQCSGLGLLNFKNPKSLTLSMVRLGSDGMALYLQCFFDMIDLSLGLLVKIGVGLIGKGTMSLKSLCIIFHRFFSISCIGGLNLVNWTQSGVGLSLNTFLILVNMFTQLACFILQILFNICVLYPLRSRWFTSFLLYFRQTVGDVVVRINRVISPMAMPL